MPTRKAKPRSAPVAGPRSGNSGSLAKALDVLDVIIRSAQPPSAAQVTAQLGLPRPTVNRIIGNLIRLGFLKRDARPRELLGGDRLVGLALAAVARAVQEGPKHKILEELAAKTEETCNIGMIVGGRVRYVDRVEAKWPLQLRLEPGSEVPLHCSALGKLLLSRLPRAQRDRYLRTTELRRYTDNTITDPVRLERELDAIARAGVSMDDEEYFSGVVGMAVPIPTGDDHPVLGLAVAAPSARVTVAGLREDLPLLYETAEKLAVCYRSA